MRNDKPRSSKPSFGDDALRDLMTAGPVPDVARRLEAATFALQSAVRVMQATDVGVVVGLPGAMTVALVLRDPIAAERLAQNAASARKAAVAFREFAWVMDALAARVDVALEARPGPVAAQA